MTNEFPSSSSRHMLSSPSSWIGLILPFFKTTTQCEPDGLLMLVLFVSSLAVSLKVVTMTTTTTTTVFKRRRRRRRMMMLILLMICKSEDDVKVTWTYMLWSVFPMQKPRKRPKKYKFRRGQQHGLHTLNVWPRTLPTNCNACNGLLTKTQSIITRHCREAQYLGFCSGWAKIDPRRVQRRRHRHRQRRRHRRSSASCHQIAPQKDDLAIVTHRKEERWYCWRLVMCPFDTLFACENDLFGGYWKVWWCLDEESKTNNKKTKPYVGRNFVDFQSLY